MTIRFASIPKCASRLLKALGLLGEVEGRPHSRITEYPDWEKYEWIVLLRDSRSWYASWWRQAKQIPDAFTEAMGFRFNSLEEDMEILSRPPKLTYLPPMKGFHAWIPSDFAEEYPAFLKRGQGFMEYCYATITCGVRCTPVLLQDLDAWLLTQGIDVNAWAHQKGFHTPHLNRTVA